MFFHGMRSDNHGELYPYASSDNRDFGGNVLGPFTLCWEGSEGLVETFWKDYLDFIKKAPKVTLRLQLNIVDVLNFKITDRVRIGMQEFLVGKLSIVISTSQLEVTQLELYKIT